MALVIGLVLALGVGAFATALGLDRDRAFYPTVMIFIASLYSLFAVLGAPVQTLVLECLAGLVFVVAAAVGFKTSLWLVAAALAAHGVFDVFHESIIPNPGVPAWYPEFCLAYDVVAAGYLAWVIKSGRPRAAT